MDFKASSSIVPGSLDLFYCVSVYLLDLFQCRSKAEIVQLQIFGYSNDAIFIIDPTQDWILEADPRACAMLGYTHEGLLSTPISAVHPNEMPRMLAFTKSVLREVSPVFFAIPHGDDGGQCHPTGSDSAESPYA